MTGVSASAPGLKKLARELEELGAAEHEQVGKVNQEITAMLASRAQNKARGLGLQHARYADAIGTAEFYGAAGLKVDGDTYPGALGVEFGAGHNVPRQRASGAYLGYNNLPAWRGNQEDAGYSLYPTIREAANDIDAKYTAMLDSLLNKVFPE